MPKILDQVNEPCPKCQCNPVFVVEAVVPDHQIPPQLIAMPGHVVYATYAGCAACGWSSKAVITPRKEIANVGKSDSPLA